MATSISDIDGHANFEGQNNNNDFFSYSKPPVFEPHRKKAWRTKFPALLEHPLNESSPNFWKVDRDPFQLKPSVVIVGDDPVSRYKNSQMLEQEGITTAECTFEECFALPVPKRCDPTLYIVDLYGATYPEEHLYKQLEKHFWNFPVLTLDSERRTPERLQQIKSFSMGYLTKPYFREEIIWTVQKQFRIKQLTYENQLFYDSALQYPMPIIINGESSGIKRLIGDINKASRNDAPILLLGEIGTRKELVANQIHFQSRRPLRYYHSISLINMFNEMLQYHFFGCDPGIAEIYPYGHLGVLEMTSGGTFYIDFLEMAFPELQESLLSCIKHGFTYRAGSRTPVTTNLRFIFSTYVDLEKKCKEGGFNKELYEILMENQIFVPSLRQCKEDIIPYFVHGLEWIAELYNCPVPKLDPNAAEKIKEYYWPFNTQELEIATRNIFFHDTDGVITEEDLIFPEKPFFLNPNRIATQEKNKTFGLAGMSMDDVQKQAILETMTFCGGNKQQTAKILGISEKTLYNKLKDYELS